MGYQGSTARDSLSAQLAVGHNPGWVVTAHWRSLLLPGQAEHSRGDRAEGREGEQEAPGSASAFATAAGQLLSKH